MKVIISDKHLLSAIRPEDVALYLKSLGWEQVDVVGDKASVWRPADPGKSNSELFLPMRSSLGDYAARLSELLFDLEVASGSSQLKIINDIQFATKDIIRVRASRAENGTLPLGDAVAFIKHSCDMVLAAASATAVRKSVFYLNKPLAAEDYLKTLRFGQTEQGSYIINIHSPVETVVNDPEKAAEQPGDQHAPFSRKVTQSLALALKILSGNGLNAKNTSDRALVALALDAGISANLCEAIVGITQSVEGSNVDFGFRWSARLQPPSEVPTKIDVQRVHLPNIVGISKVLRDNSDPDFSKIKGMVVKLERWEPNAKRGKITLRAYVHGLHRPIYMSIPHDLYNEAIKAHKEYLAVQCIGRLKQNSRGYHLVDCNSLEILPPSEFDAGDVRIEKVVVRSEQPSLDL